MTDGGSSGNPTFNGTRIFSKSEFKRLQQLFESNSYKKVPAEECTCNACKNHKAPQPGGCGKRLSKVSKKHESDLKEKGQPTTNKKPIERAKNYVTCSTCSEWFPTKEELNEHSRESHVQDQRSQVNNIVIKKTVGPTSTVFCVICSQSFASRDDLENHRKVHLTSSKIVGSESQQSQSPLKEVCAICDLPFENVKLFQEHQLLEHSREHNNRRDKPENIIGRDKPENIIERDKPENIIERDKPENIIGRVEPENKNDNDSLKCEICQIVFVERELFEGHKKNYLQPFKCFQCKEQFKLKEHLVKHVIEVHEKPPVACSMCGQCFPTEDAFKAHHDNVHKRSQARILCANCPRRFIYAHSFHQHSLLCVPEGGIRGASTPCFSYNNDVVAPRFRYRCIFRGCMFESRLNFEMVTHIREHINNENFYQCSWCDYTTRVMQNLVSHINVHSHGNLLKCPDCNFISKWKHNMTAHLRTHQGKDRVRCHLCVFGCALIRTLKRHYEIAHPGVDIPDSTFPQTTRQRKPYSSVRLLKCKHCDFATFRKPDLDLHYRQHK